MQVVRVTFCIVLIAYLAPMAQTDSLPVKSAVVSQFNNPRLKTPITLWAKDANLSEVLKVLSERSGMNFVSGSGVYKEQISIFLDKTPLDEAINILVRAAGLAYEIIGNSVLIAEPEKLKTEVGQMGYVVELKYAEAAAVADMLADLTKNIKVDEGGNRLICFTSPRVINEIEKVVKAVDHPHILVLLETRLIEVVMDESGLYGFDWAGLSPITAGVTQDAKRFDRPFTAADWTLLPMTFRLTLDMALAEGDARMLMDSKLTTTNNREATLHIGEVIPYEVRSYNLSASGGANFQIQKEEVGVKVAVTPHVNEEGQVTLTLEPEVSSIIGWKGANADIPHIRVRKTSTTVRVEDGQTVFLAGLLSEENTEEIRKLPVLGDIPVLGLLFQHKRDQVRKSNLVIEITPRIIHNADDSRMGTTLRDLRREISIDSPGSAESAGGETTGE
jgi:type II secretory pathway component GspD/PulD (secretin)